MASHSHRHTHTRTQRHRQTHGHTLTHAAPTGEAPLPHGEGPPPYPMLKAVVVGWVNAKLPEAEGWAAAAGALGFARNVNTPDGLLFVKLKFVVLLPNWKTDAMIDKAEKGH